MDVINPIRLFILYCSRHSSKLNFICIIHRNKHIILLDFIIADTIVGNDNAPLIVFF